MQLIQSESVTDIPTNSHDGQQKIAGVQPIDPYSLKQTVFKTNLTPSTHPKKSKQGLRTPTTKP
jgi:hypothetical protein